jgi:hypothetical protein
MSLGNCRHETVLRVDEREGLFLTGFQCSIEDGLETGSGCRAGQSL